MLVIFNMLILCNMFVLIDINICLIIACIIENSYISSVKKDKAIN